MTLIVVSLVLIGVAAGLLIRMRRVTVVQDRAPLVSEEVMGAVGSNDLIGVESGDIPARVAGPSALAVDAAGQLVVGGEHEVAVLSPDGKELVRRFPVAEAVTCLAAAQDGTVLAGVGDHVVVYGRDGRPVAEWAMFGTNAMLTSLVVDEEDVYVADAGAHCVWRLDRRGKLLVVIRRAAGGFVIPSAYFDVAVGAGDGVWVVDPGRHEVINYSPQGEARTSWGKAGFEVDGFSGCCNPIHIALLADGSFVTAEKGIARVKKMSTGGAFIGVIAGPASFFKGTRIADLAVDGHGRVLVLDPDRKAIRIFEMTGRGRH